VDAEDGAVMEDRLWAPLLGVRDGVEGVIQDVPPKREGRSALGSACAYTVEWGRCLLLRDELMVASVLPRGWPCNVHAHPHTPGNIHTTNTCRYRHAHHRKRTHPVTAQILPGRSPGWGIASQRWDLGSPLRWARPTAMGGCAGCGVAATGSSAEAAPRPPAPTPLVAPSLRRDTPDVTGDTEHDRGGPGSSAPNAGLGSEGVDPREECAVAGLGRPVAAEAGRLSGPWKRRAGVECLPVAPPGEGLAAVGSLSPAPTEDLPAKADGARCPPLAGEGAGETPLVAVEGDTRLPLLVE